MNREEEGVHPVARLLAEARAGSAQALGQLLGEFRPYLLQIANAELDAELRAKEGPSDLVQLSFMEAAQGFERFTGDGPEDFRVWLRQILSHNINDLRDRYQTQKRQTDRELRQSELPHGHAGHEVVDEASSPSERVVSRELLEALEQALGKLSAEQRELIRLRHKEGKSFVEIAQVLGVSEDAVHKRWTRAVEELRGLMDVSSPSQ